MPYIWCKKGGEKLNKFLVNVQLYKVVIYIMEVLKEEEDLRKKIIVFVLKEEQSSNTI